jgi:WD40 repeat protein/transcriptional regulator with XRE-family HTH domain
MRGEGAPPFTLEAPDGIESRAELARALTALRARAGLTIRALAASLDIPPATVGGYFSGRHLPGPGQIGLYCQLLRACGVAEDDLAGWVDALTQVRLSSDGRVGRMPSPYRGLEPFQTEDAELFFGREAMIDEVLSLLRGEIAESNRASRLVMLLGPSGSGKSSLVRAGVAARVLSGALDQNGSCWSAVVMTPGEAPHGALQAAVRETSSDRRLLIVDQLEEVFAVAADERAQFFHDLGRLDATVVLAALRADFYDAALREPLLLAALRRTQILLAPMNQIEVRRAVIEPPRRLGVVVDEGLVDLLIADLTPRSPSDFAHEAGALPFLSHALRATWERAQRNQLTIPDYTAAGGLRGAVSQTAEDLYGRLDPEEQEQARRLFCRLVKVEDDGPLTRRRISRRELDHLERPPDEEGDPNGVLSRFVAARLITVDADTIELSHDALLGAWPRLTEWIARDRASLRMGHQVTDATNAWVGSGKDPSLLLRGIRLQASLEWAEDPDHDEELNQTEHEFLTASTALAEAERVTERKRTRRTQRLLAVVSLLAIAAAALALFAFHAGHEADQARDQALSRQVAIEANGLERTDPGLAMQLALAAYRIAPTTQATSTLLDASAGEMPTRLLGAIGPTSEALSGSELAVSHSATDQVTLYSLIDGHPSRLATLAGPSSSEFFAVALSPNGRLLAAGGTGKQVVLWSLAVPERPVRLATLGGFTSTVYGVTFSPDGRAVAAADGDGTVREWSLTPSSHPVAHATLVAPGHAGLQAVAYSPNGRVITAAGADGTLVSWESAGDPRPLATRHFGTSTLTSLSYSPDGRTLAVGAQNDVVHLFSTSSGVALRAEHAPLGGFTSWVDSLAFSPDGRFLAAGDSDSSLQIWSTRGWTQVATLDHPAPVTGVRFTDDDQYIVTVDEDGTTRIWSFPPPAAVREPGGVYTIDYTANGDMLAAVSGGPAGDVDLWNVADPWRPSHLATVTMPRSFGPVAGVEALSPNGKLLAVGNAQAKVRLIGLSNPGRPRLLGGPVGGATPFIEQLNFSPDMRLMSIGDDAGRIHIWNITDPSRPTPLPTLDEAGRTGSVFGVAYSPDDRLLAAAGEDGKVWLWGIANPHRPQRLAVLGGFGSYAYTVAFTPDGHTLIAGGADDTIRLWNITNPAKPQLLGRPLTGPTSTVYDLAVSPNGATLAAATTGGDTWLWNISDPAHPLELADLTAATGQLYDVTFSPNDNTLVASGGNQTLTFWNYHPAQVATRICDRTGTPVTRAEWAEYVQGTKYDPPCLGDNTAQ